MGSVYPMPDKMLTHSGGDTGGDAAEDALTAKKKFSTVKPIKTLVSPRAQLLDSTGKMTKSKALANGYDRAAKGSR